MSSNCISSLSPEKLKLIKKYSLTLNDDLVWEFNHDKYHTIKYFTNKFATKESTLAILFNIHRLCFAKIKYFEKNLYKYTPHKYNLLEGFKECELYDTEFLYHKYSGMMIDLRYLQSIKNIEEFKAFCKKLESFENKNRTA